MTPIPDEYLPSGGAGREEMERFYSWTFEDAMAAQEEWSKTEHHHLDQGPFFRWVGAWELIELATHFKKTLNNSILLEAINTCALYDLPIPQWCAMPYREALRWVKRHRARSWDDVFGRATPKGAKVDVRRKGRKIGTKVFARISDIRTKNPEIPLDRTLFESVGDEYGIKGSTAEKYYYDVKTRLENPSSPATKHIIEKCFSLDRVPGNPKYRD